MAAQLSVVRETGTPAPPAGGPAGPGRNLHRLGADDKTSVRVRIVDGALRCVARQGTVKTTADDIAKEAKVSRATVYRTFPGGMDAVFAAIVDTEVARLFSSLAVVMGEATDLEDVLVSGIVESARRLTRHEALRYLMDHEPGVVLRHLAFGEMDRFLAVASAFTAPFFGRWLEPEQATRAAEWAVRIVVSYLSCPSAGTDLTDERDARHLVETFVLPGILALRTPAPTPAGTT
jgi:AcrR family transcriptional regulator